jgi:hypothetical protein
MAATFFQGPLLLHHSKGHYLLSRGEISGLQNFFSEDLANF